jgi:hypothetical protein
MSRPDPTLMSRYLIILHARLLRHWLERAIVVSCHVVMVS